MPTIFKHRNSRILTLAPGETIDSQCRAGDIVLVQEADGWWTNFIDEDGAIDRYDAPFPSYNEALWAAKAAAEFAAE